MADHCASSAGRQELDVKNYHIPGLMLNLPNISPKKVDKMASQIDIFTTLFSLLNWNYNTNLYGTDVLKMKPEEERAFVGTYRKLGLLKGDDKVMVLGDQKVSNYYQWNRESNELVPLKENDAFLKEIISNYQTISNHQTTELLLNPPSVFINCQSRRIFHLFGQFGLVLNAQLFQLQGLGDEVAAAFA